MNGTNRPKWKIAFYVSPSGNPKVLDWLLEQDSKVKAKFAQIFDLLEDEGILVGMPHVRHIVNTDLYEVRVKQNKNIYRIFYFIDTDKTFVMLHGFQKKDQKTPKQEIELAQQRMREHLQQKQ